MTPAPDPNSKPDTKPSRLLIALAALASGVQLCRDSDGQSVLPFVLAIGLQLPLLIPWTARAVRQRRSLECVLTMIVLVGALAVGIAQGSLDAVVTAPTIFVVGCLIASWLGNAYRFADVCQNDPARLLGKSLPAWIAVGCIAAIVLALPISTQSSVPDYKHNLLLHVANNAFAAASAACLTGWTTYGFGDDYTPFGQAVLWLVTQFSGCLFAAVGLAIMRPFLRRTMSLRGLLIWAFALQGVVIAVAFLQWAANDAPTPGARFWWGAVHGADAMWNTGLILRANGLAPYLLSGPIYALITLVALAGSLGLPVINDLLRGPVRDTNEKIPVSTNGGGPWRSLPAWEAGAAFWLLVSGAIVLAVCETPGIMPNALTFRRPFEFGMQQMSLRDDIGFPARVSLAIHVSAMLRSAGIQSMALAEGGITIPSYGLMLGWMIVGGSIAGTAGGMRVSTLVLLLLVVLTRRPAGPTPAQDPLLPKSLARSLLLFALLWMVLTAAAVCVLGFLTDGSVYQIVFDGVAALNNVGLTTGLIVHVSWPARLFLIATMVAGRLIPLIFWAGVSARVSASSFGDTGRVSVGDPPRRTEPRGSL